MHRSFYRNASVRPAALFAVIALLAVVHATAADAQGRGRTQFTPARSTVSPYLGLLQTNTGPVPNYFSIVRPMLRQKAFEQQVQAADRVRSLQIQSLQNEVSSQSPVTQTGKGAGFMQFLHYYPPPATVPWQR